MKLQKFPFPTVGFILKSISDNTTIVAPLWLRSNRNIVPDSATHEVHKYKHIKKPRFNEKLNTPKKKKATPRFFFQFSFKNRNSEKIFGILKHFKVRKSKIVWAPSKIYKKITLIFVISIYIRNPFSFICGEKDDKDTNKKTNKQIYGETDTQTNRKTNKQTNKETK